ncbi:hypothetical protein FA15DRAFT_299261 [Coprinopsis marcescibilis]|uniref:Uncharacterized protein n=1 Tax=Coprinopsis marcescibilis TaxID=230819 RepID=A0A5C3L0S5_COPMA|nr:hypothetical protein FA15DRAFT_299261 [Coprinopsis marcescibilis]
MSSRPLTNSHTLKLQSRSLLPSSISFLRRFYATYACILIFSLDIRCVNLVYLDNICT